MNDENAVKMSREEEGQGARWESEREGEMEGRIGRREEERKMESGGGMDWIRRRKRVMAEGEKHGIK